MGSDGYERIDFDDPRTKWTVSQRKYKPVKVRSRGSREEEVYPWRVVLTYWAQDGTGEDGTPTWKRRQRNHTLPASVTTRKGAMDKAGAWVAKLRADQDEAMQNVADRREREEAERRAEEEARARAAKLTVCQCVDRYIQDSFNGGFIEASTVNDYRKCASRIRATMEDIPLDELNPEMVTRWQVELGSRYAHSTMKKTRNVLRVAIQAAMDNGQTTLEKNPVVTTRKTIAQKRRDKATAPKLNALDRANRSTLLAELDGMADTPVTIGARIGLYAGLREAEVCALQWKDVDLEAGFISVNKAIGQAKGGIYMKPQKNDAEGRDIPINPELAPALMRWRNRQQEMALLVGAPLSETFVIGNPTVVPPSACFEFLAGTDRTATDADDSTKLVGNHDVKPDGAYHPAQLSREWRTLSRSSRARGMLGQPVTFHNLRHSFGFYAANEGGVKIEQLAEWMGHESIVTTQKYYVARDREAARRRGREAMEQMARKSVVRDAPADVVRLDRTGTNE